MRLRSRATAVAVAIVVLTGVALATPVAVLRIEPDGRLLPVGDGGRYEYSYQQSIYQVPVNEEHVRDGNALRIARVRSRDLRAVEYFRWDGEITRDGDDFVQNAPPNQVSALMIRITHEGTQHLRGAGFDLALRDAYGESLVTITPVHVPWILARLGRAP